MANEELLLKTIGEFQSQYDDALNKTKTESADAKSLAEKAANDITSLMEKGQKLEQASLLKEQEMQKQLDTLENVIISKFSKSGEEAKGIDKEYKSDIINYFVKGNEPNREMAERVAKEITAKLFDSSTKSDDVGLKAKGMLEGIGSSGGYLVIPERVGFTITQEIETSPFRAYADVMNIAGNSIEILIDDDRATVPSVVGETTSRATLSATPKIGVKIINAGELSETVAVTQRILDDYPNIDSYLLGKLQAEFYRTEATNLVSGDGVEKHFGLLSKAAWTTAGVYERDKIEQIKSGINGSFTGDFFIDIQNSLYEKFQKNAVWFMKRQVFADVLKLKDTTNNYLINLNNMMLLGADKMLLGNPVVFASDMQAKATDSLSVLYGDIKSSYQIIDRLGMRIMRDPYTSKPQILFTAFKRSGGDYKNYQGVKIGKLSA